MSSGQSVLFVDLNNSSRFPALAVGYLVGALRRAGVNVEVFSPLSVGVPGFTRDLPDTYRDHLVRRVYFSANPAVVPLIDAGRRLHKAWTARVHPRLISSFRQSLARSRPGLILISAYLDHRPSVEALARIAQAQAVPVVLGGPMFNLEPIASAWSGIAGVTHIFGGEAEDVIAGICRAVLAGDELSQPGVHRPDRPMDAPRRETLANLVLPDFSDFPWELYPQRVLTVMTGRGCGWGRCTFCSDVVTANGRGFRSRPLDEVLSELDQLSGVYDTQNTFFLDIKLNSDLQMWDGIIDNYQRVLPGGRWIGTVHVAARGENGLDRDRLRAARAAGMTRISFGLESASERLTRTMGKGTSTASNLQFMIDAKHAGLSVRTSMMLGYPGETAEDVAMTAAFLREHGHLLDRVRLSRFKLIPGTRLERLYKRRPSQFPALRNVRWRLEEGRADYEHRPVQSRAYRRAKAELLRHVYRINRKPLPADAAVFNGLM